MKNYKFYIFILFTCCYCILHSQEVSQLDHEEKVWLEVPVLKINFYMMGKDSIDESITLKIGENVEYLNQEFEGKVKFVLNGLVLEKNHAYLPDLHLDFFRRRGRQLREIIHPIEEQGAINVFLFETYSGLEDMSTLVHEMGHFLGLRHPWEMTEIDQELMGLNSADVLHVNHMTYELTVSDFTDEQLERMRDFALRFRHYLVKEVEQQYN